MQKYCRKKCKIGLGCVGHEGKDKTYRDVKELDMSERLSAVLVLANQTQESYEEKSKSQTQYGKDFQEAPKHGGEGPWDQRAPEN